MHPINERRDNVRFDPYYFEKQAELIAENQKRYGSQSHHFRTLKLTSEPLPPADLLLCRDCFVHFSIADICSAVDNIKDSRIAYLLTTTFPNCQENEDITTGDWRLLNLEKPPFNFPTPLRLINPGFLTTLAVTIPISQA